MPIKISSSPLRLFRADTSDVDTRYRLARSREQSMASGLDAIAQAASQIAAVGEKYREQERLNYINKTKILGHIQFGQAGDEWEQALSGENAMESVGQLKTRLSELGNKLLENAPDDKSREVAGMQLALLGSNLVSEAGRKAHAVHVKYSADMVDQALNDTRKSAYHSGLSGGGAADLTGYLDAVDTTLDAQAKAGYLLSPVMAGEVKRRAKSDIAKGFVRGGLDSGDDNTVLRTVGDLQAGRYNTLDFEDLMVLGHSAAAARERVKNKREAEAREARANAEDGLVSKVYAAALSITSQGDRQDPGAAAALLFSPTAKDLFKGASDKTLAKAASWARSSWEIAKGREAEQKKDLADTATDVFEDLRRKGELSHDKIETDPSVPIAVRKTYHDILDRDAEKATAATTKTQNEQSKSIAANLLSRVASGEITRVSEVAPYRTQGLQDDEFNTVVKGLENIKQTKNRPWMEMADNYLKTVTKSESNKKGILEPNDVVRVHSIIQDELDTGKLEARDILKRTQELTDMAYTGDWLKWGDRDIRRFEVEPGGALPVTEEARKARDKAVDIIKKNDPDLYNKLYGGAGQQSAAPTRPSQAVDKGAADVVPEAARKLIQTELQKAGKDSLANDPEAIRKVWKANKDKLKDLVP